MLNQPLAGNVDEPEGSLDALMQAMVCRQRVGWRQNARKIILMATDREEGINISVSSFNLSKLILLNLSSDFFA